MERDFGLARLRAYWPSLKVPAGAPVFVPLYGKSRDMRWLAERGHSVIGVEFAPAAAEAFFVLVGEAAKRRVRRGLSSATA